MDIRNIVVVNDDGIYSEGLNILVDIAISIAGPDNVFVVAPREDRSGASHSTTSGSPIRYISIDKNRYLCSGTPADCAAIAVDTILKDKPVDLILSGINSGSNSTMNACFSGTISAAIEGVMMGAKFGIALSQASTQDLKSADPAKHYAIDWTASKIMARPIIEMLYKKFTNNKLDSSVMNVNFPVLTQSSNLDEYRKINRHNTVIAGKQKRRMKVCDIRQIKYGNELVNIRSPKMLQFELRKEDGGDFVHFIDGYATITPIVRDPTNENMVSYLDSIFFEND